MFRRLRLRFAVIVTFLVGTFILLLCSTTLAMTIGSDNALIREKQYAALDLLIESGYDEDLVTQETDSKFVLERLSDGTVSYLSDNDETARLRLADVAVKLSKVPIKEDLDSSSLKVDGKTYYYTYRVDYDNDIVCFAVDDYSNEKAKHNNLLFFMIITFVVGLLVAFFISLVVGNEAAKPVMKAFEKQKELITNASHELKTPITIIDACLANINDADNEEQDKWLSSIQTQSRRMNSLVCDMLALAKMEKANESMSLTLCNLSQIVEERLLEMDARCYDKGISIDYSVTPNVKVLANSEQYDRVISILLDNAAKYTPCGGKITVSLTNVKKTSCFKVRNTGLGIRAEQLERVFERFYKVDDSRVSEQSTHSFGLGLSIAKTTVEAMKGTITADSVYGEYTEFTVRL